MTVFLVIHGSAREKHEIAPGYGGHVPGRRSMRSKHGKFAYREVNQESRPSTSAAAWTGGAACRNMARPCAGVRGMQMESCR